MLKHASTIAEAAIANGYKYAIMFIMDSMSSSRIIQAWQTIEHYWIG
jgi:hypothetical protein